MKGYKFFPHTADIGLRLWGRSRIDLFEKAAEGTMALLFLPETFLPKKKSLFFIRSKSWEFLLVDWLQEILYRVTVKKMGFSKFKIKNIGPYFLSAIAYGEKMNTNRSPIQREIKAVTYHNLKIKRVKRHYLTKIFFDI